MEAELKRDHAEMQGVIEAKQKIIDAQVYTHILTDKLQLFTFFLIVIIDAYLK